MVPQGGGQGRVPEAEIIGVKHGGKARALKRSGEQPGMGQVRRSRTNSIHSATALNTFAYNLVTDPSMGDIAGDRSMSKV